MQRCIPLFIIVLMPPFACSPGSSGFSGKNCDLERWSITRLTESGERPVWSPEGNRIAFMDKEFGEAMELNLDTGGMECITCGLDHPGFLRVHYLADGNFILTGARPGVPPAEARLSKTELWFLKTGGTSSIQSLDLILHEGIAVSRRSNRIAWTVTFLQSSGVSGSQLWQGSVGVKGSGAEVVGRELVLEQHVALLEAQDWFPRDAGILFTSYFSPTHDNAEVMGIDLAEHGITNYSRHPAYDEAEGLFPDGEYAAIESGRHDPEADGINPTGQNIDLYLLRLDGTGSDIRRLTYFGDETRAKANNPVVNPDGTRIAFSRSLNVEDPARITGEGDGIFLLGFECPP